MAAVTICSDFGAPKNKVSHCFHCIPLYLPWSDGTRCHDPSFFNVEFEANFFTHLFHFHQEDMGKMEKGGPWSGLVSWNLRHCKLLNVGLFSEISGEENKLANHTCDIPLAVWGTLTSCGRVSLNCWHVEPAPAFPKAFYFPPPQSLLTP